MGLPPAARGASAGLPHPASGEWQDRLLRSVVACDPGAGREVVEAALAAGLRPEALPAQLLGPVLVSLAELWVTGRLVLTQQFVAARVVEEATLRAAASSARPRPAGASVVVGTLLDGQGLGAHLVAVFLRADGLEVIEAGSRLSPERLAASVWSAGALVAAVSVLTLRSAERVAELRQLLAAGPRRVKLVVGGAPFRSDPGLARRVGADAWAQSAIHALSLIRRLLAKASEAPP